MGNVLAFCEFQGAALRTSALANLAAARQAAQAHSGEVIALLVGAGAQAASANAAKFAPKVVVVEDGKLGNYLAETYAPVVAKLAKDNNATVVTATATAVGKDLMPRVAALLDAGQASDIAKLEGATKFMRPILAGNAYSTVEITTPIICLTVRQSEFEPAGELGSAGSVSSASAGDVNALGAELVRLDAQKSDRPELTDAKVVVSGGRGLQDPKNFELLRDLAAAIGNAAVGASRAVVDAGWVPYSMQIGQTGKTVKPEVYIAVGISGATQHMVGMKEAKRIVAINKDKDAPIFSIADLGIVGDALALLPKITEQIRAAKR